MDNNAQLKQINEKEVSSKEVSNKDASIDDIQSTCTLVKNASRGLVVKTREEKGAVLKLMAKKLAGAESQIIAANQIDVANAKNNGLSAAMIDRLTINSKLIQEMQASLEFVAELDDPLEKEMSFETQPSGIKVGKKRIPIGVILMIYESRPNVTVEAAALALKSGNSIILRGGKEAFQSNQAIAQCWQEALRECGFDENTVCVLDTTDRSVLEHLLKLDELIDLVIPRGGEGLIRYVVQNSYIPVIKHYKGVCHLYLDESGDADIALDLIINGKTQRPGVCNALEGILIHRQHADLFLPKLLNRLSEKGVTIYGCAESQKRLPQIAAATEQEFLAEFLDLKVSLKVVEDLEAAIQFIQKYGSNHTEVIVTQSDEHAEAFINRVDASVVMVNASSRFSDGGQLGLGAEIGISTSKLHAYGPMGLESLTSEKFVVIGQGQVRG